MKNIKIVYCQGAKWRDKVNGNTYNNVKVIDGVQIHYLGYAYGYDKDYYYRAKDYFNRILGEDNFILVDLGSAHYPKKILKNNAF